MLKNIIKIKLWYYHKQIKGDLKNERIRILSNRRNNEWDRYFKEIGQVKTKKGEYHKFIHKDKEYPIEKVVIKRNNKGYIVSLNK